MNTPKTLQQAIEFFSDELRAIGYFVQVRWPDGNVKCPTCGAENAKWLENQKRFQCKNKHPRRQFSVKVGTIFEDSPLPLKHWLLATWQLTNCKNGISSYELARAIGVTQKSAWFMLHRIRLAMQTNDRPPIDGEVEVDETYIGGKARNMNRQQRKRHLGDKGKRNAWAGKVPVMGFLKRDPQAGMSKIRTMPIPGVKRHQVQPVVMDNVQDGSTVYTDQLSSYHHLPVYYDHKTVDHAEKYVDGQIHTNGLENYWSLLKRALRGTYVAVEPFHLFRYLDEQAFRFNERTIKDGERFDLVLGQVIGKRIMFDELTGKEPVA